MSNIAIATAGGVGDLLSALGEHLSGARPPYELVVIGGSGLLALGLIERATRDVDVVALVVEGRLLSADPFPPALCRARDRVARDFGLPISWLNPGPAALTRGLPSGFAERLSRRTYGPGLVVHLALVPALAYFGVHGADLGG